MPSSDYLPDHADGAAALTRPVRARSAVTVALHPHRGLKVFSDDGAAPRPLGVVLPGAGLRPVGADRGARQQDAHERGSWYEYERTGAASNFGVPIVATIAPGCFAICTAIASAMTLSSWHPGLASVPPVFVLT